jgi:ribose transport system substrate-binding protein
MAVTLDKEEESMPRLSRAAKLSALVASALTVALALTALAGASSSAIGPYVGAERALPLSMPKVTPNCRADVRIGFQVVADNESNVAAVKLMRAEARRLGVDLMVLYNHVRADKQVTDFDQMIAQKVDGIIFYPLDPRAVRPSIQKAKRARIPLFAQDAILPGQKPPTDVTSTIISGRDHQAYLQVREMARIKPGAKIVVIGLGLPVAALEYYVRRVQFWAKKAGLEVLGRVDNPTDNEAGAEQAMRGALGRFPDIDGILAYNDPSALGAYAAARAAGKRVLAIGNNGGNDGRAGVERGRLAATVQVDWPGQVVELLRGAFLRATRPNVKLPKVLLGRTALVNKGNLDKVKSWDETIAEARRRAGC